MPVIFRRQLIADMRYESAGVFDVTGNGQLDIVSGEWWYEGPDFRVSHRIGDIMAIGEYFDDFSTIPMDINGNGRLDYLTGGFWGNSLRWRENPGDPAAEWSEHVVAETGSVETTRAWDVDGDGQLEVIPNTPGGPLIVYKLITGADGRGTGVFEAHTVYDQPQGHGLGCGDIAGNDRMDIVLVDGWLEAPAKPFAEAWTWHPDFHLKSASVPILVVDVNQDGLHDLIVGQGHDYGLSWWEQRVDADGRRAWVEHPIDPFNSQYHDLHWVDIDGDGSPELVTGKRYRAHNGRDPGAGDDVGVYYFKWTGESFVKQVIDFGPARVGTGLGIHAAIADLNANGRLDIVAPGKDGLYVFWNEGTD